MFCDVIDIIWIDQIICVKKSYQYVLSNFHLFSDFWRKIILFLGTTL